MRMDKYPGSFEARRCGFSLVEVTLALGIAAFCLIAIFGLIPAGLGSNRDSVKQTTAASVAARIVSDLRSTPAGATASPFYGLAFPAAGQSASTVVFLHDDGSAGTMAGGEASPNYRAYVAIETPPGSKRTASSARVLVSWPAAADSSVSGPPAKASGSFETVIGLDRN